MYATDEGGNAIVGTLMRVDEDANSRYRFEIWFDYTRQIMNRISEGAMVAVPNFFMDPANRRLEWCSVLEIFSSDRAGERFDQSRATANDQRKSRAP